jgi:hypothetical protein
MPSRHATAVSLNSEIGSNVYVSPPSAQHTAILAGLRSAGVLTPAGVYASGKGLQDVENFISVPHIGSDVIVRATNARAI